MLEAITKRTTELENELQNTLKIIDELYNQIKQNELRITQIVGALSEFKKITEGEKDETSKLDK
jgi:peptidoglycan hydrolase CwlO-like protein